MTYLASVAGRVLPLVFGCYLAMSYPLIDDKPLSLAIGTLGVIVVGGWSYACGFWDAMRPEDKRPFRRRSPAPTSGGLADGEG